jgi:Predicted AAA-ATPase/PD-(D/E)XK nuclease superfamily
MKLPISIQDFEELREGKYLYIDKTDLIFDILALGQSCFLTKPRRFGKSLCMSTLKYAFLGKKHLFEGLYMHDKYDFQPFPVLHLDFSGIDNGRGEHFSVKLIQKLVDFSKNIGLEVEKDSPRDQMNGILDFLEQKKQELVVLVDEYDKPLLDNLGDIEIAQENQRTLRGFYEILKSRGARLRFFMVTGITKFSQMSLFSSMNQLRDISFDAKFATLCGYTAAEIDTYFPDLYKNLLQENNKDSTLNYTITQIKEKVKSYYNGYNFGGTPEQKMYNPFGLLHLAATNLFKNYWFETGNPRWLLLLLKQDLGYSLPPYSVDSTEMSSFDIERVNFVTVLYQTGYVTVVDYDKETNLYTLDFPNREVKETFLNVLLSEYIEKTRSPLPMIIGLRQDLKNKDFETFFDKINTLFASIPYQIFIEKREAYYHSILHIAFTLLGFWVESEVSTSKGRIDTVLQNDTDIFILEFKIELPKTLKGKRLAQAPLAQINEKDYTEKYKNTPKNITKIGIALGAKERGVVAYLVE